MQIKLRFEEQRDTANTVGGFAQCTVDLAWGDHGFRVRRPHPVNCDMDVMIGDVLAMTDDHFLQTFGLTIAADLADLLKHGVGIIEAV